MKNKNRLTRQSLPEKGIAMIATSVMMVILIPMIGLAVDVSLLYSDRTHLQGAVDGAALAGAKALSRGNDDSSQQTAAAAMAAEFVYANYPTGFFFSSTVTVNQATDVVIDESVANQRTVKVTAHATVPTLFMRWLRFTSNTVTAAASVTRKDVNIVVVMDRSGSLATSGSCDATQAAAVNFVNKFANGRDMLSLVTFATSTRVDFPIANNFQTATTSVPSIIDSYACAGSTSSAMALWTAYDQLVGLNQPAAVNVILFFTDGKPTGVNVDMPVNTANCGYAGPPRHIKGLYNTYTNSDQFFGLLDPYPGGTNSTGQGADMYFTTDGPSGQSCNFFSNVNDTSDFAGVNTVDLYGDRLDNGWLPVTYSGSYISLANATNADNMTQNAALDAAVKIRAGTAETGALPHSGHGLAGVQIFSVGLGNAPYPLSVPLLQAMSNDPGAPSPWYLTSESAGLCVIAPTTADINSAFSKVASEILRISK